MTALSDKPEGKNSDSSPAEGERIAKRMARAGLCSRRDAERWIAEGRVTVNGQPLESPAVVVKPGDVVVVDGKVVPEPEQARLWRYHKPAGLVTTARDEKGRSTVFDHLPEDMPRVISVGRLDLTTEGLLLLTNDGEIARYLELPATGWTRRYRVRVHGAVNEGKLASLAKGLTIEGVHYGPIEATLDKVQGSNAWLSVGLKEGKNREIRKVMEAMELQVTRLIRLSYGPFQLGKLAEGAVEEVPQRVLADQLANFFQERGEPLPAQGMAKAKAPAKTPAKTPLKPAAKGAAKPAAKAAGKPAGTAARLASAGDKPKPAANKPPRSRNIAAETAPVSGAARPKRATLTLNAKAEGLARPATKSSSKTTAENRRDDKPTGNRRSDKPTSGTPTGNRPSGSRPEGARRDGAKRGDDKQGGGKPRGGSGDANRRR